MRIALSLGKLHRVHTLACVPVKERTTLVHGRELREAASEQLLHSGRVRQTRCGLHLADRWNGAEGHRDVVRNPLDKLGGILPLKIQDCVL